MCKVLPEAPVFTRPNQAVPTRPNQCHQTRPNQFLWLSARITSYEFMTLNQPETNKSEFILYFELFEKSCRGRHHSEISKTNAKTLIFPIWIHPQGSQGCQKMRQDPLNMPFEVWCANIAPKLKNIQKSLRKQVFFDIFFQF